jgi:hypothetical protein
MSRSPYLVRSERYRDTAFLSLRHLENILEEAHGYTHTPISHLSQHLPYVSLSLPSLCVAGTSLPKQDEVRGGG